MDQEIDPQKARLDNAIPVKILELVYIFKIGKVRHSYFTHGLITAIIGSGC